ncbi:transglutaminase domain-containing protein [Chitinophaga sp. Hz27]|uniref:transglutaminase domain-containing protein n=1 Tax=Chitinophaga sp. Hz27 TaxID=3347169 RepID=UPI0035D99328
MRYNSVVPAFSIVLICLCSLSGFSQDGAKMKYGKISKEEFKLGFDKDTGAHAIIISEIGSSSFESDGSMDFNLVYKIHRRIKIVDKAGADRGQVSIMLYHNNNVEETVSKIKATAYNLENGQIVETKLESKDIYTEKIDDNRTEKKFAIPAIKEGTIIEYSYVKISPYYENLEPWTFQHSIPTLWSEYTVSIPEIFDYVQIAQGFEPYAEKTRSTSRTTYIFRSGKSSTSAAETGTMDANVYNYRWAAKDLMPIRDESYVTTVDNYVNKIEFQLSSYHLGMITKDFRNTWPKLMEALNKNENFGVAMGKNNNFMDNITEEIIKGAQTDEEKAMKIFNWIRTNIKCTDRRRLTTSQKLKTTLTEKKGDISDVNLLLVGLLRRANLKAAPVILSTRENGYVYPYYPMLTNFNYIIALVEIDGKPVKLDATHPMLGFGKLLGDCYNGDARIVDDIGTAFNISADSLHEIALTTVTFDKFENGGFSGQFQQQPTYLTSYKIRTDVAKKKKEGYFESIKKAYNGEVELSESEIENLEDLDNPVLVKYNFKMKGEEGSGDDVIYLNPMLGEAYKHNIFKAAERRYPVEMPAVFDEIYTMNLEVPEGYVVDEMPKPAIVNFNDNEGQFQYLIQQADNRVQLRCRVRFSKATFPPDDYESLRSFFDMIVKKQAEQIVLKKKKA